MKLKMYGDDDAARRRAYDYRPRRRRSFHGATAAGANPPLLLAERDKLRRRRRRDLGTILRGIYGRAPKGADAETRALYSKKALFQRESLTFHPGIRAMLEKVWEVTDEDGSGGIEEGEYYVIQRKLYCALVENHFGSTLSKEAMAEWQKIATGDWADDARGEECIEKRGFFASWFALVDVWTDEISAEEYMDFLAALFHQITFVDRKTGLVEFKEDISIPPVGRRRPPEAYACACKPRLDGFAEYPRLCQCFGIDPELRELRWRLAAEREAEEEAREQAARDAAEARARALAQGALSRQQATNTDADVQGKLDRLAALVVKTKKTAKGQRKKKKKTPGSSLYDRAPRTAKTGSSSRWVPSTISYADSPPRQAQLRPRAGLWEGRHCRCYVYKQ
eukprot:g4901.t1